MLDNYTYTYFLKGILFFIFWLGLFVWRKDIRKEMLTVSIGTGLLGPIADLLYIKDWWTPQTITGTAIGFEAFFVGFMIGGIATAIYEVFFKKKIIEKNFSKKEIVWKLEELVLMFIIGVITYFASFYILDLNSFLATVYTLLVFSIIIYIRRPDLIILSLTSGFLLLIVAAIVYSLLEVLTPGWVVAFWHFTNVPQIIIFNVPIDDIVWYFLAGMVFGPFYEFWKEEEIVNLKK